MRSRLLRRTVHPHTFYFSFAFHIYVYGRLTRVYHRQVQAQSSAARYDGVWRSLVRMWQEEGFRGFMRGNGINCLRIVPYSAVQFTTYEQLKKVCNL